MRGDQLDLQESLANAIDNRMVAALIVTFLGCAPIGLIAVYHAAKVNTLKEEDDLSGALEASRRARKWCWAAVLVQIGLGILYITFLIVTALLRRWR